MPVDRSAFARRAARAAKCRNSLRHSRESGNPWTHRWGRCHRVEYGRAAVAALSAFQTLPACRGGQAWGGGQGSRLARKTASLSTARPCRKRCRAWRDRRGPSVPRRGLRAGTLRSWSQKKRASARRARSTRSLPATMALPPSSGRLFATNRKCGAGLPSGIDAGKILLMGPHCGLQDFRRQRHEIGIDRSGENDRELGEPGHLIEQPRIGFDHHPQFGCVSGRDRCGSARGAGPGRG